MRQPSVFIRLKVIHCICLVLLLITITFSILFIQTAQSYIADTHSRLGLAVKILDKQFSHVTTTVEDLLGVVTGDCVNDGLILSNSLVTQPVIQSLNIVRNREVICSTHKPNVGLRVEPGIFLNFNIITSSIVLPGKTIVIIQKGDERLAIGATLHGFNLFGAIELLKKDAPFHINYNGLWINADQKLVASSNPDTVHVRSTLFPYSVSTNYDYSSIFRFFLIVNSSSLVILFIFSISCGVLYWVYGSEKVKVQAIKRGLARKEFEPYAQGVTDKNGNLTGCEILMRWVHGEIIIRPDDFIPTAEKSGLIVPMSICLIEETFMFFREHAGKLEEGFHIAFNISPLQLSCKHSKRLIEAIRLFRQCEKLNKIKIVLELTERQIVVYTPETLKTIHLLHDMGIQIVIDDFGTGYSSLENLLELQIDGLKIDKRFVDRFPSDLLSISLVDNMIHLAQKLDIPIVAEGVETQEQATALAERHVNYLQGYLFYRPLPLKDFIGGVQV